MVVCCRDRPQLLAGALPCLRAALRDRDELIVVDSWSRSAEVALLAAEAGARVHRAWRPGASLARNVGWRAANRPVVAFTDDDCRPEPGWLDGLERRFTDPAVGFVYGAVGAGGAGPPLSVTPAGAIADVEFPPSAVRQVSAFGHGANLAVRRTALAEVGGWDERLGAGTRLAGAEDADLALRLLRAGWAGRFAADAAVRHLAWRSRRAALRTIFGYGTGAGALAVKSHRADGDWWLFRHEAWVRSLRQAGRDLRAGYEYGAAAGVVRLAGVLTGAALEASARRGADGTGQGGAR